MSTLLWSLVDTFLSRLRSVQYYYQHSQVGGHDYHSLFIYDYIHASDKVQPHKHLAKAESGVG